MKPTKRMNQEEANELKASIFFLNGIAPVAVDNCLGVQLGYTDKCHRGKDFVHIMPSGEILDCSFQRSCFLYTQPVAF